MLTCAYPTHTHTSTYVAPRIHAYTHTFDVHGLTWACSEKKVMHGVDIAFVGLVARDRSLSPRLLVVVFVSRFKVFGPSSAYVPPSAPALPVCRCDRFSIINTTRRTLSYCCLLLPPTTPTLFVSAFLSAPPTYLLSLCHHPPRAHHHNHDHRLPMCPPASPLPPFVPFATVHCLLCLCYCRKPIVSCCQSFQRAKAQCCHGPYHANASCSASAPSAPYSHKRHVLSITASVTSVASRFCHCIGRD